MQPNESDSKTGTGTKLKKTRADGSENEGDNEDCLEETVTQTMKSKAQKKVKNLQSRSCSQVAAVEKAKYGDKSTP